MATITTNQAYTVILKRLIPLPHNWKVGLKGMSLKYATVHIVLSFQIFQL